MTLLDTDICIGLLRGNRAVVRRRESCSDAVAIAAMTAAELFYGAAKSAKPDANRHAVEQFIMTLPILHSNVPMLRTFGQLKTTLELAGTPLPDADIFIAATALTSCAGRLITGNRVHFQRFPGLMLDDWLRT